MREGYRDTGEEGTEDESEEDSDVDTKIEAFDQEVRQQFTTDYTFSNGRNRPLIIWQILFRHDAPCHY